MDKIQVQEVQLQTIEGGYDSDDELCRLTSDHSDVEARQEGADRAANRVRDAKKMEKRTGTTKKKKKKKRGLSKGDLSNSSTFIIMVVGIVLNRLFPRSTFCAYLLSFGLFAYAGGITNWLAVKMLFDRIPLLVGSGVIPRQFKAIRKTVKNTIMRTFFDKGYLEDYLRSRSKDLLANVDLKKKLEDKISSSEFDANLARRLEASMQRPEGGLLRTISPMFGGCSGLVPHIKPMVLVMVGDLMTDLVDSFDPLEVIPIERIRKEIDKLMTQKLKVLTPDKVKDLMEDVIRDHLGWLIVWGNVFGGLIGILSQMCGFGRTVQ
mmetsp:Transcript_6207/g.9403  ORF Transcript_6207/g.9403 Transcript_6207/m.9403 type:complete len:321 (-) Transcript_6207:56-1018(-)|eukprot:CAMPEP_0113945590 /NCGR_PEP_ID=MMETSP1339-20121228/48389_1 /TAXON_ID=94617 /ORGANISM="Fibrocapsa japonica" /LENGTH=320 /DNA_ID=CAMNT_0000951249 /DNA_START=49 /DNA_END=1011 /DNA_ORIENTATION=+ /assembly_acc=CAM_ASM_000762